MKYDDIARENIKQHNPNWLQNHDHLYRILLIGGSGSGKTNTLLNFISHQPDTDQTYLYAKDPFEAKYQMLINKRVMMILKILLHIQMIFRTSINIFKNKIKTKNVKY